MVPRVAVSDPLPLFRRGVIAVLTEAGIPAESPDDLMAWARVDEPRIVVLTILGPDDWTLLSDLSQIREDITVLAMVAEDSVGAQVKAITSGASSVVPRSASTSTFWAVFEAVLRGGSLLPVTVTRALGRQFSEEVENSASGAPTVQERDWLRQLAHGVSVAKVADQTGYSERMMFRLLRDLYARIGANNRTEALIRARDENWI